MKGLYNKYIVTKADGEPIDQNAYYLVLRLDAGQYVDSCRAGALQFAMTVLPTNPLLAQELIHLVLTYQEKDANRELCQFCKYKIACEYDGILPSNDCPIHW